MTLQVQTAVGEQQYLRVQNVRIQQYVSTTSAILGMVMFHPDRALRYVSEAQQVLEPELADHPLRDWVGKTSVVSPHFIPQIFEQIYVFISAVKF